MPGFPSVDDSSSPCRINQYSTHLVCTVLGWGGGYSHIINIRVCSTVIFKWFHKGWDRVVGIPKIVCLWLCLSVPADVTESATVDSIGWSCKVRNKRTYIYFIFCCVVTKPYTIENLNTYVISYIYRYICILELPNSTQQSWDSRDSYQWFKEVRIQRLWLCG